MNSMPLEQYIDNRFAPDYIVEKLAGSYFYKIKVWSPDGYEPIAAVTNREWANAIVEALSEKGR